MAGREPTVADEEILFVLADAIDPVLDAPEVAADLPIGEQGTYERLRDLEDEGLVGSKKIARGRAWWITVDGEEVLFETFDVDEFE